MDLACRVGLNVAQSELTTCLGKDVLLVDRFDRTTTPGQRRRLVSALTMLGLDEMFARYATYPALALIIRKRFTAPEQTLQELFSRIVFNICIGNIDDHARNHAAFWDESMLTLTPAYDLCPQPRSGLQASQAMAIGADGQRASQLRVCQEAAPLYGLTPATAREIIDSQVEIIHDQWSAAADAARLTAQDRAWLWQRQILSPYIFED
jgi:serine/threonine-protein kinase HipA